MPKLLILSVTRSLVLPKSKLPASDNRNTGCIASFIWSLSQPARAIYPNASAASLADFVVVFPISLATFVNSAISAAFAPLNPLTLLILFSKF